MWVRIVAWLASHLSNSWMTNMDYGWFMAHSGWGGLIIALSYILYPHPQVTGYLSATLAVYAFLKEYWYDAKYETPKQTFKDNTEDFLGYITGLAIVWGAIAVKLYVLKG